eukprot:163024-Hanusia_phi.AAC.1
MREGRKVRAEKEVERVGVRQKEDDRVNMFADPCLSDRMLLIYLFAAACIYGVYALRRKDLFELLERSLGHLPVEKAGDGNKQDVVKEEKEEDPSFASFQQRYKGYGYQGRLEEIRRGFEYLPKNEVYVDHAGSTLSSSSQLQDQLSLVSSSSFGNPHSRSAASLRTAEAIRRARLAVLEHFHARESEYAVVFTSGCTQSIKIVAENFRWTAGRSLFAYTVNNHNSVLGARQYAKNAGCAYYPIPHAQVTDSAAMSSETCKHRLLALRFLSRSRACEVLGGDEVKVDEHGAQKKCYNLFAFPAECNFSGQKQDLRWVRRIQGGALNRSLGCGEGSRWMVLVDAAKYVSTSPLRLDGEDKPDFVAFSFYKMFGYPTGLGALLVKRESAACLEKKTFSGGDGTVLAARADDDTFVLRESLHEKFEDGTVSFLSIMAAELGLRRLQAIGMERIEAHTWSLRDYFASELQMMRHANGREVAKIYGPPPGTPSRSVGSICSFNILQPAGGLLDYSNVEELACLVGISLRTGSFCNPGANKEMLGHTSEDVELFLKEGKVCGDRKCIIGGKATGAVRVSFGYMSTFEDARRILDFVERNFVDMGEEEAA